MTRPLTLAQIAASLEATPQILQTTLTGLPQTITHWQPAPDAWCINEIIGHMIEADRHGFDGRIRTIIAADMPQLQVWSVNETAAHRHDCEADTSTLIAELSTKRTHSTHKYTLPSIFKTAFNNPILNPNFTSVSP